MRALAAGLATLTGCAVLAAQDAPSYRASVELVSVYATVVDAKGRQVSNLPRSAFSVYDNGQLRPLSEFGSGLQPFSVVVMLDYSGSVSKYRDAMKDASLAFIQRLGADDKARIGIFATDIVIRPDAFTADHAELAHAVQADDGSVGGSPVWVAIRRSVDTVATQPGRRVVLAVSDGRSNEHPREVESVINRAVAGSVMVYTVGLTGQESSMGPGYPVMPEPPRFPLPGQGRKLPAPRQPPKPKSNPPSPSLEHAASETGGGYFRPKDGQSLSEIFVNVADELHQQYLLGFLPEKLDGTVHRIEVRVNQSGLRVRARESYLADLAK